MDKYEYKVRSEEISKLIDKERYAEAVKIADTIDWRRVKSASMLLKIAALYRISRRNEDSREMLMLAYERYPTNRSVVYSLCELSIELDDVVAAIEYYKRFVKLAPRDNGVYTLRYRILEAQEASLEERIEILEELKKKDYQEEWAYELAYLYHRVGLSTKCAEECDDIILWFGDGPYVMKAMELKAKHVPLTEAQQQKYEIMLGNAGQNYSGANYEPQGYDAGDYTSEGYSEEDYNAQDYTGQNYDGQNYDSQDYTGQNYAGQGYAEQNYDSQGYDGQNYAGQGYVGQNYDGQEYTEQNYNGQNYDTGSYDGQEFNETNYDAQGYAAADYNGQFYENDYGEGDTDQSYADGYNQQGYSDQSYVNGYDQQEYADQSYAGGYDQQGYADQSYDDGYQQENDPDQQYEADYGQQNYAGGNYAQNHMVDDGYGNLSYVDGAYQDSGYTSEFYVEQTYDENGNLMNSETYADDEYTQGSYVDSQGNAPGDFRPAEQADTPKQYRNGLHLVENTTTPAGNSGDMSQYNTINLQKVVAESMKELFPDDNDDVFAEDREKYNSGEEIRSGIGDTRIFAGAVKSPDGSQTGRVNVAQMVTGVLEKAPEPHTGAIKKVLIPGEDARTIKSDSDIEELRDTTEKSVDDEHSRMEYNDENVYHEQSIMGANETDTPPSTTEPMKLDEVLVKWERMKQDNAKKHQEEIKKRVESQTGKIFADFDNSIKSGILGELEREEQEAQRQNQTDKAKKGTDGFLDADVTGDIPRQPASDDDFDVSYVTEQKPPKKEMKIERADDVQEPGTTAEQDYAQIDKSAQNDGSAQVTDDDEPDAYTAKTDQETPGTETYAADEPVNDTYSDNPGLETELKTDIEIETEPATQEPEKADAFTQKISIDAISQYDMETMPDTEESDTEASEGYTRELYADAPEGYTEEVYADAPEGYTGELYADAPEDDTGETYTDAPGEYTEELYTDAPEEYTGEVYAEVSEEENEETDFETSEEYREAADTSYADDEQEYSNEYADDSYTEDSYIDDSYVEDSYTEEPYMEDSYDDLEDAYSESPDESRHTARRQNYEYNERDLDPEDAESIAEMAKEDALKTQEIKMNTADLSSLSEKIVATTKKEASGAKREEIRDFTPEEQTLFENFAVTKKIKKQIVYALENMTLAPYTGNVIITGDAGLDTVRMAKNLVKEYQALDESFSGKLAKITGEKINQRNIKDVFEKLNNGGMIIEKANGMSEEKLYELATNLNQDTFGIVVIMEDTKKEITKLLEKQAMIVDYFNIRIDLMEMDNNALVAYAKNYALALEYSIDELGTLALYTRIANMQSGNHVVTKDEVRDIIDEAIWKSKKSKIKNFVDVLFARRYDNEDMIVLKERDFM